MPKGVPIRIFHATTAGALPPAGSLTEGELALDALSNPPRLWTQVPTSRDPSGRIDLLADGAPTLPLSVANGGTGATTAAGALDSLSGTSGATAGWLNRNAAGQWVMTDPTGIFAPINNPNFTGSISLGGTNLTGLYAPLTNPANGQNNYASLASPNFTGTVSIGGTALSGLFAPLTNPANGQNNYLPIANPTFTGTLTGPNAILRGGLGIGPTVTVAAYQWLYILDNLNGELSGYVENTNSGNQAQAGWASTNNLLNTTRVLTYSSTYAAAGAPWAIANSGHFGTSGSALVIATYESVSNNTPVRIFIGQYEQARFDVRGLTLPYSSSGSSLNFGSAAAPRGALTAPATGALQVSAGSHYTGLWVADATAASMIEQNLGAISFYRNTGLTVGNTFTPTQVMQLTGNYLTLAAGWNFQIGNVPQGVAQTWTPVVLIGVTTQSITVYYAAYTRVGQQVTIVFGLGINSVSGAGNVQLAGLPAISGGTANQGVFPLINFAGFPGLTGPLGAVMAPGQTAVALISMTAGAPAYLTQANVAGGANLQGSFTYLAA